MIQKEAMGEISIEKEMKKSYLDYAMSVIIGRALPDVRDGLKPVHRRVLFAMRELKNDYNKPYKKSAQIQVFYKAAHHTWFVSYFIFGNVTWGCHYALF